MNDKTAVITGITGQDGSYLAELLLEKGYQVWGMVRRSSTPNTSRIDHLLPGGEYETDRLKLCFGDLSDSASIFSLLSQAQPGEVYNLRAQSHVQVSFENPVYTGDVTGLATARLLEALRKLGLNSKFYQASTSELYGKAVETPQTEATPFQPRSPYADAKAYAFYLTKNYRESYGMFAVNGILFNHESPRRGETFVTRKITRAVGRIVTGRQQFVSLGNLDARRDWGFAGDYVRGMWLMLQSDVPDDFVLSTGETHTVREFCELAFARAGLPVIWKGNGVDEVGVTEEGRTVIRVHPDYFRPAEVDLLLGDASRAEKALGWKPDVSFRQLIDMMVDHDLELARSET